MEFLCRDQGEALREIKSLLRSKNGESPRASAVFFRPALLKNKAQETVILEHRSRFSKPGIRLYKRSLD